MRYCLPLIALSLLILTGCPIANAPLTTAPVANSPTAPEPAETPVEGTLVTLKVPNMVCDGCAGAVRKDLVSLPGIANIKTDPEHNILKFVVTDETLDWKAKLAEIAKENSHLEDWSVVEGG